MYESSLRCCLAFYSLLLPPFDGEIVYFTQRKNHCIIANLVFFLNYLLCSFYFRYSVFNERFPFSGSDSFRCRMVGPSRLELPTSRLSGARSNLLSYEPMFDRGDSCAFSPRRGGDDGIRTHDPLLAGQVLSQLSYTPMGFSLFLNSP